MRGSFCNLLSESRKAGSVSIFVFVAANGAIFFPLVSSTLLSSTFVMWHWCILVGYSVFFLVAVVLMLASMRWIGIVPFYERRVEGADTFKRGYGIGKNFSKLEQICSVQGVCPLSEFGFLSLPLEPEQLIWFEGERCLQTIDHLLAALRVDSSSLVSAEETLQDLVALRSAMVTASEQKIRFCFVFRLGGVAYSNSTWAYGHGEP